MKFGKWEGLFSRILARARTFIGPSRFIYVEAVACGLVAGFAAIILKLGVHRTEEFLRGISGKNSWILALFPLVGIGLSLVWARFVIKDDLGHGVSRVLEAIAVGQGRMKPHNVFSSIVGCVLTAGAGGSVGMEAPILATGGGIGSLLGQRDGSDYRRRVLLTGCGVAAGLAGIFKAPVAGVVFCIEVLALDATASGLIPLLLSAATACLVSMVVSGFQIEYSFSAHESFSPGNVPLYVALGVLSAFLCVYFMRMNRFFETALKSMRRPWIAFLTGGFFLALLIFIFPPFFGEGYHPLRSILTNDASEILPAWAEMAGNHVAAWFGIGDGGIFPGIVLVLFCALLVFGKPIATALTTGSGGIGGVFAPCLLSGALSGFAFARVLNLTPWFHVPEMNFALAGMAGAIAGVMHAPFTAIFLIAELSGGYQLLVPLMIVSSISFAVTRHFEPWSVYTRPLAVSGRLLTHHKDKAALTLLSLADFVIKDVPCLEAGMHGDEIARRVADSPWSILPVKAKEGITTFVWLEDLKPLLATPDLLGSLIIDDIARHPAFSIDIDAGMEAAMDLFASSGADEIPVFERGKFIGILPRTGVFTAYRDKLKELSREA